VALLEGRVSIRDGEGGQPLELRPGEAVNYEDTVMRLSPIGRLSNQPQAWVDKSIRANGMTVQDIIDTYEDTYGYKIILGDPVQAGKKIDGSLSLETEDGVLYTLANILNANIHRQGKIIYLNPK
jgi:ferric-dicitrate binding protein FerR (iron transport regulator)